MIAALAVELVPHTGRKWNPDFGWVTVDHRQYYVYCTGTASGRRIHCGYVGTQPNAPFNAVPDYVDLPQEVKAEVVRQIHEQLGGEHKVYEPAMIRPEPEEPAEDDESPIWTPPSYGGDD